MVGEAGLDTPVDGVGCELPSSCPPGGEEALLRAADLDLRPQGPARWALEFQVQRCGDA